MKDKDIPQLIWDRDFEPIFFPKKDEVCRRLDEFYRSSSVQKDTLPSSMFHGALYGMRKGNRENNPDWMAQVSHSLREIFYKLGLASAFKNYGSTLDEKICAQKVGEYYNFITDIAHHNFKEASKNPLIGGSEDKPVEVTQEIFESVVLKFGDIIFAVLRRQIDAHNEIDKILKENPDKLSPDQVKELINLNPDAQHYFFSKADEQWLDWLWENGFLDIIKEKAENPTRYGYTPEIGYLVRMAEKAPEKVVDIMLNVPISSETFNPEVVTCFLRICSGLPTDQTARVVEKIRDERWIPLMSVFNRWGFEYEKMFKTLANTRDYKSVLTLSKAVLAVRTKEEIEKASSRRSFADNPFYFDNLSYTKVFEHLANIEDGYVEQALALATTVISEVITLWSKEDQAGEGRVFKVDDNGFLSDVDFFTLELGQEDHLSSEDDVCELAAVIKVLAGRLIEKRAAEPEVVRKIYIGALPDSHSMWRLRLFVMSLCPEVFKEELKKAFFRLFEVERYYNGLLSGAEYLKALRGGFPTLSDDERREYVKQAIECFTKTGQEKGNEDWNIIYGSRILSVIEDHLTKEEKQTAKEARFKLDPNYQPEPSIRIGSTREVLSRGPITQEEFGSLSIAEIADKLRAEWTPEKLAKQKGSDDFHNPLNADGTGKLLKNDIPKRLQEYVDNADSFFERGGLDQHYTYSYLCGIEETIKNNRATALNINWDGVIDLCIVIKKSGENDPFEREKRARDSFWFANWDAVHSTITDVLKELLTEKDGSALIDFSRYRDRIFAILGYLLFYPDPSPADEQIETATQQTKSPGDGDYMVSDPLHMAINAVRGRAYEAFASFVCQEGKKFKKEDKIKIDADVKALYESVLKKENTRALMFMFGHYLPIFYFRDRNWMRGLLPQIFPQEPEKKPLYTAAWEGYITNNLYEEMFFDPEIQKLYERGLALTNAEYPEQKHFKEPSECIAEHFAIAFMYYKKFGFDHPLFNAFWKKNDTEQHAHFISFIGRLFISGSNANADKILKKLESKKRLKELWDWTLEHYDDPKLFVKFDFWINLEKGIFEPPWLAERVKKTFQKTKGALDADYNLVKSIVRLGQEAPKDTLEIARQCLLESGVRGNTRGRLFDLDNEWTEAFRILYSNPETKSGTYALINELLRDGGSTFWNLKEIMG